MSILEQMKKRKNLSPTIKVLFPSKADGRKPELELEIRRLPPMMARHAMNKGFSAVQEGNASAFVIERAEAMLLLLKEHIVGWKALKKGWPEYSVKDRDELIENLDTMLMLDLVNSYDQTSLKDEKDSGNGSSLDSETP